ncbi:MAG TPA: hypothetical protein VN436_04675 [Holophaga sp.]|nr:hypothetical protein [Holophaga sp.]
MRTSLLLLLVALLPGTAHAKPAPGPIDQAVSRLIQLYGDGIAVSEPEFRSIAYGHFFDAESADAIALFSLEGFDGSNYHGEYIAFFQGVEPYQANGHRTRPFKLIATMQIGGREWRTFDWKSLSVRPGEVTISGKAWADQDPGCCPSRPFTTAFRLREGRIVEGD